MTSLLKATTISFALASTMFGAITDVVNTAPSKNAGEDFVSLLKDNNYKVTNNQGYWSYTSATTPAYKYQIEGNGVDTNQTYITLADSNSHLVINGSVKSQNATINIDMQNGGTLVVQGAPQDKGFWNSALTTHFGVNKINMGNRAVLQVDKNLISVAGGKNIITMDKSTLDLGTSELRAEGNGYSLNKITATNSTITVGNIKANSANWNGNGGSSNDILLNGGKLTVKGDVTSNFDRGHDNVNRNSGNNIVLNGGSHEITGSVVTDGAFGGNNYIQVNNGGVLTIGKHLQADYQYVFTGTNVDLNWTDNLTSSMQGVNSISLVGNNAKLYIKGNMEVVAGDGRWNINAITMSGAGLIDITGDLVVRGRDGATNRKATWEGKNQNIINAQEATLNIGQSLVTDGNAFGVVKADKSGNRINVKNLTIGGSIRVNENDQSNLVKINGGVLDIKSEVIAVANVNNGATSALNYIELANGSTMTVGRGVLAKNHVDTAKALNYIKASKSNITINGNVESVKGGMNDFNVAQSNLTFNGKTTQLNNLIIDSDSIVTYKGNLSINNITANGGTFVASGADINDNLLTINNSDRETTYNLQVLSNVRNGDVIAVTRNAKFVTEESDDGLLTTKLVLKEMKGLNGVTTWIADNVKPMLSRSAYEPNKEIIASTNILYLANMNSLNKRMGELRSIPNQHGAWGRIFGGEQSNDFSSTKMGFVSVQAGYDYSFSVAENKNLYVGTAFSYGYGSADFNKTHTGSTQTGIAYNLSNSSLTQNLVEVALYASYVENSGWYNDTIFKIGGLFNSMNSNTLKMDNSSFVTTLSNEFGYRFNLGANNEWYIDPQAEVTFGYTQGGEFSRFNDISNLVVSYDGTSIFRERLGLAVGYKAVSDKTLDIDVYAGLYGEFDQYIGGDMNTNTIEKTSIKSNMKSDIRGVVNYGANVKLDKGISVYGDMEHSFGGKLSTTYKVNAGIRYSFGDTKKLVIKPETEKEAPVKLKDETKPSEQAPVKLKEETKPTKKASDKKPAKKVSDKKPTKKASK